jgi:ATP-binding cassette, subfamily B, bacterial CvaB/MchF/RaxB
MQSLLNFSGKIQLPIIRQTEAAECGLACLAMVISYHGHKIDLNTLRRRHPVSLNGVTLRSLIQLASHLNMACRPVRFEIHELRQLRLPAILHWDMNHFVVLKRITGRKLTLHDPASGEKCFTLIEASKHMTGIALELTPTEGFRARTDERSRLKFSTFWGQARGTAHALAQIFALSAILELLVIAAPLYMQVTIDEVIVKGDVDLLFVLAVGFGLLTLISVATNAVRSFIILILQSTLDLQIAARMFHHLIRLPLAFFEKRHIGDVLSRFTSIGPIRDQISEGLIAAAIDGLMAIATLVMIFIYSGQLATVVLIALVLYAIVRIMLYHWVRQLSEDVIEAKAQESSNFIETLRAMQTLKLFNRESDREGQWLNRYADFVNANIRLGRAKISFKMINDVIFGAESIITVYIATRLALDNILTVGMIFAFMSYKQNFLSKAVMLIEQALEFRLLELHLERLSDIALSPLERGHNTPPTHLGAIRGGIELRNVCFRYSETDHFVLNNVNLRVEPGQFVTIMGPSGGGKTTLMKVMLGLLEPTTGEVLIDGIPLSALGPRNYREHIAAVMQEDQLLSGSIADNISFFDPAFDHDRMIECAVLAGIHDEIMFMPMNYNSLIGDMGSSLSGGQKQRLLLARALYRQPKILFLDEGTSHLDIAKERYINESLRKFNITRISIAHRPEVMSGADAILQLGTENLERLA